MNLKTKAFGVIAGAALSLSLITAAAADGSTSVTLSNGAACSASVAEGTIDFGTWTWNGTSYVISTAASGSLTVEVTNAVFGVDTCDVNLSVGGMTGKVTGVPISSSQIVLTDGVTTGNTYLAVPQNSDLVVTATLSTDLDTLAPDTYVGVVTVGSATAAN